MLTGLTLTLNIDQDDYVDAAGDIAGARLLVLPQGRMSFPEDQGITVAPGRVTYLGVQQVNRCAGSPMTPLGVAKDFIFVLIN